MAFNRAKVTLLVSDRHKIWSPKALTHSMVPRHFPKGTESPGPKTLFLFIPLAFLSACAPGTLSPLTREVLAAGPFLHEKVIKK